MPSGSRSDEVAPAVVRSGTRSDCSGEFVMGSDLGREEADSCAKPAHVVVVDDEPTIREICADVLSSEGYQVSTAENGQQAVALLAQEPVDLVLMDIMMPVMDGLAACQAMKA